MRNVFVLRVLCPRPFVCRTAVHCSVKRSISFPRSASPPFKEGVLHVWLVNSRHTFFTFHARYLFDLVRTFPRDRLGAARARQDHGALVAPWQMPQYRSPRTAPSRSREKVRTSLAGLH